MRNPTDAFRSMKKYLALSLGDDWEVRLVDEEGTFKRPHARVGPGAPSRNRMENAWQRRTFQRFSIVAYPKPKTDPSASRLEAMRVEELLLHAFAGAGAHTRSYRGSTGRGHPMRIPLWDYDDVALNQATPKASATINPTGANNSVVYTAKTEGNDITIRYRDPNANSQALSVDVNSTQIIVNLATGVGGAITSTADQVKAAIAASDADDLVSSADAAGNDGTGVVTAIAATRLTGDRLYNDFMVTTDEPVVGSLVDEADETLYTVTVDLTVSWTRSISTPVNDQLVERVESEITPS